MTLSEWRNQTDVRVKELAKAIGTHPSNLRKWEAGTRFPNRRALLKIIQITHGLVTEHDFTALPGAVPPGLRRLARDLPLPRPALRVSDLVPTASQLIPDFHKLVDERKPAWIWRFEYSTAKPSTCSLWTQGDPDMEEEAIRHVRNVILLAAYIPVDVARNYTTRRCSDGER